MIKAIMNLLLVFVLICGVVLWIAALVEFDGVCHIEDCEDCPYEEDCPYQKRRSEDEDC